MSFIRRTVFAFRRGFWDALDAVGDNMLFSALSVVALAVLTFFFVTNGDWLSALLWGLGAVAVVFVLFVLFKLVKAWRHPDVHRDWEWNDYGVPDDMWRIDLTSFAALRPRSRRRPVKPLLCRVIAPDKTVWESSGSEGPVPGDAYMRFYPQDFKCSNCDQRPPQIPAGEYEITWLQPVWGPLRRPLLRYTQHAPQREQVTEPGA